MANHHFELFITQTQMNTSSHGTEQQAVLIGRVAGSEVVEVEHLDLEYSVVGTHTEVGHRHYGSNL